MKRTGNNKDNNRMVKKMRKLKILAILCVLGLFLLPVYVWADADNIADANNKKDIVPPESPANLSGEALENGIIRLKWTAPPDKDLATYRVYREVKGVRAKVPLPYVKGGNKNMLYEDHVDPLSPFPYVYYVSSFDAAGNESRMAGPLELVVPDKRPPRPPVLTRLSLTDNGILISWAPPPDIDLKGFWISRREKAAGADPVRITKAMLPAKQTTYTDRSATGGITYSYFVTAVDKAGNESKPSGNRSQRALRKIEKETPGGVTVNLMKEGNILLTWKPVQSGDILGYMVYRSISKDKDFFQVSGLLERPDFKDSDVRDHSEIWYRVRAFYRNGHVSSPSDPVVWRAPKTNSKEQKIP
jgi:hypothetical protein